MAKTHPLTLIDTTRPPYQREFVYAEKQRNAVIDTVMKGFPLNVMYWATREDGTFEVIDGQQRLVSLSIIIAALRDLEARTARIEPGVVMSSLQAAAAPHGHRHRAARR